MIGNNFWRKASYNIRTYSFHGLILETLSPLRVPGYSPYVWRTEDIKKKMEKKKSDCLQMKTVLDI